MMVTFDIRHPDIEEFIKAKREDGRLRQFNMSCLITDRFMDAVKNDNDWNLIFPANNHEANTLDKDALVYEEWHSANTSEYVMKDGLTLCRIYKTIKASSLWDLIMRSTYEYAEPGFILVDRINRMNNLYWLENIQKTNPCGR